jgi:hypothetical protein
MCDLVHIPSISFEPVCGPGPRVRILFRQGRATGGSIPMGSPQATDPPLHPPCSAEGSWPRKTRKEADRFSRGLLQPHSAYASEGPRSGIAADPLGHAPEHENLLPAYREPGPLGDRAVVASRCWGAREPTSASPKTAGQSRIPPVPMPTAASSTRPLPTPRSSTATTPISGRGWFTIPVAEWESVRIDPRWSATSRASCRTSSSRRSSTAERFAEVRGEEFSRLGTPRLPHRGHAARRSEHNPLAVRVMADRFGRGAVGGCTRDIAETCGCRTGRDNRCLGIPYLSPRATASGKR